MAKLTIVRPYEWYNQSDNIFVFIDDEKIGHVGVEQTTQFNLSAGIHNIVLRDKWACGSQPIQVDLSDNENTTVKMSTFRGYLISMSLALFLGFSYPVFRLFLNKQTSGFATLLFIFVMAAFVLYPFLKKHYLNLEEVGR